MQQRDALQQLYSLQERSVRVRNLPARTAWSPNLYCTCACTCTCTRTRTGACICIWTQYSKCHSIIITRVYCSLSTIRSKLNGHGVHEAQDTGARGATLPSQHAHFLGTICDVKFQSESTLAQQRPGDIDTWRYVRCGPRKSTLWASSGSRP